MRVPLYYPHGERCIGYIEITQEAHDSLAGVVANGVNTRLWFGVSVSSVPYERLERTLTTAILGIDNSNERPVVNLLELEKNRELERAREYEGNERNPDPIEQLEL